MEDTYLHKGLRQKLVEELRQKGISDERVLTAIGKVPRHVFMDSSFINYSYKDKAFPIGAGQTISQPFTVAFQTQLLNVQPGEKVLEIGTGSGYQAAVLLEMGARVFTVERQKELYVKAMHLLPKLGYRPNFFFSDGTLGLPAYAPFDKIIVTAAAEEIPQPLLQQLRPGGRLVVPVGKKSAQQMMLVEKISENEFKKSSHGNFIFVPLLKGIEVK
ncbi:MAG: protein-L-isoaspartate(D-aspartate) O-methyltransferase [Bacteroidales bacterium]|nr:protein-L-isoaspartate(D-aspartate) O-methyltransferase [Bacteroidales bacterium]